MLRPFIINLLGSHYCYDSPDLIEDEDERIQYDFGFTLFGKISYNIYRLFYPFFRKYYDFLIILRILLLNYPILTNIIRFNIFQLIMFNEILLLNIIIEINLNLSNHLLIVADGNKNILKYEINRIYGKIIKIKNYKIITFWTLRSSNHTYSFNYAKANEINYINLNNTYSRNYIYGKNLYYSNLTFKRNFCVTKNVNFVFFNKS